MSLHVHGASYTALARSIDVSGPFSLPAQINDWMVDESEPSCHCKQTSVPRSCSEPGRAVETTTS